jgi:signal transduction histidine kinase
VLAGVPRGGVVRRGDLALAVGLAALGVGELFLVGVGPKAAAVPLTLLAGASLYWRRVAPLVPVVGVFWATAAESLLGVSLAKPDSPMLMGFVALYAAGAYLTLRPSLAGLALAVAGLRVGMAGTTTNGHSNFTFTLVVVSAAWLVGRGMHGRVRQSAALALRTRQLEQEREAERLAAVAEERRRIARELHDVIAHSVSVMVVQAGAAEDVFERDPAAALEPIRAVQETGREALVEISRLLGLLRDDGAELGLAPQPRLADLEALVDGVRASGQPVELRVEGRPAQLPLGIDLSAYRIAQEALTNALKHAPGAPVSLVVRYGAGEIELEVENDGAAAPGGHRGGHGLVGMRERVAVFGGTLDAGPRPEGGFRVLARLPAAALA